MVRRVIVITIAATWAVVVGALAGGAHAQPSVAAGEQFVLSGVVFGEGEEGVAWVQEPTLTGNQVLTVRLGDSVGPYRLTKILEDRVELEGPGGKFSVPLAGPSGPGRAVASTGAREVLAGELPTRPALNNSDAMAIPRGNRRRNSPDSTLPLGAGTQRVGGVASQAGRPRALESPAASAARDLPAPLAVQTPAPELFSHPAVNNPNATVIPRGDPRRNFPASTLLIGAGAGR